MAVNCDMSEPPKVWGVCRLARRPQDDSITLLFTVDTGSDVTVIPSISWPPNWKLRKAGRVIGVGGVQFAQKSADLLSITVHSQHGTEKPVNVHAYVLSDTPPLLERDAQVLLGIRVTNLPLGPLWRTRRSQLS